jgi:hypothetical protein
MTSLALVPKHLGRQLLGHGHRERPRNRRWNSANYAVYGRIPARQNAHVGSYGGSISVTITY